MLANSRSSARLAQDASYETRLYGRLDLQQELGWVQCSAVLKSNLLFLYEGVTGVAQLNQLSNPAPPLEHPHMTIIVEGCVVDMVDSNACGADFSFAITFSSTGRRIVLAAQNEQEMERWVAQLSSSSMQHISLAKQALLEQKYRAISGWIFPNPIAVLTDAHLGDLAMPAYHSKLESPQQVGNMALLPLRTSFKGPANTTNEEDILDEAINYFKPNIFFREFPVQGAADRTLIYATFYIQECLRRLTKVENKTAATKELNVLALSASLPIPGEARFPLNDLYRAPANKLEEETMRAYLLQIRNELNARLLDRVFPDPAARPSKWWMCFSRRRFMDKSLLPQGAVI